MTLTEFLSAVSYSLRGIDDDAPAVGSEEGNFWVATLNRKKNELYNNARVLFDETWEARPLGTVTAGATPEFDADSALIAPSDEVYIVDSNSNKVYYDIVRPRQRSTTERQFYLAGVNPKILYCSNEITATEDIVGGTLYLPGYYMPDDISGASEELPLPDPYWGVAAVAAEIAGTDITYEDREANLTTKANALYMQMVRNNRRGTYGNPKKSPTSVYRVKSTEVF
jgi:hypothetical protein